MTIVITFAHGVLTISAPSARNMTSFSILILAGRVMIHLVAGGISKFVDSEPHKGTTIQRLPRSLVGTLTDSLLMHKLELTQYLRRQSEIWTTSEPEKICEPVLPPATELAYCAGEASVETHL